MEKIPLIIDCDPGVDDAYAIILANHIQRLDVLAVTTLSGNVDIELTTKNALMLTDFLGMTCVVAKGEERPLVKENKMAYSTHGSDGIGGATSLFPPQSAKKLDQDRALKVLKDTLMNAPQKVAIAAIGPLTNIALLLKVYPEVKEKIKVISIMGGAINHGNVTPCSEFNFHVDPEAASIVLNSGVPIILSGIHLTIKATLTESDIKIIQNSGTKLSKIVVQMIGAYTSKDTAFHDPCAILALSHPELFKGEDLHVQVDTREGITRGMSYAEYRRKHQKKSNCHVLNEIDLEAFRKMMVGCFS